MKRLIAELIGDSPGVIGVRTQAEQLLRRHSTTGRLPSVLLLGETGTGKGLLAKALHDAGPRAARAFVSVNCAAIPETLLEAELFGFEQGAFTDARHAKAGLFQTAHRGTLFLDEIGLLPETLQAKLLTVLEDRMVRRLGSTRTEPVDVWIITASSDDVTSRAGRRRFREDLFHRLAVVTLRLPALRDRGQDIVTLAEHFLAKACADYGLAPKTLAEDARDALLAYRWPGNVRELANVMERVALLTDVRLVTAARLELTGPAARPVSLRPNHHAKLPGSEEPRSLEHAVEDAERARIHEALHETRWNISHAAERLGVTRNTLRYRLQKYKLRPPVAAAAERTTSAEAINPTVESTPASTIVRWERRHVALLRADIVTASSGSSAPDAGSVLETLVDKIQSFGGQIEEVSPRGLMAGFGLEPIDDVPRRAAHAALAIQKLFGPGGRSSTESPGVSVGLHVGDILIAQLGGAARLEHDSKREACTQLDAVMASAQPGLVVVSEATRAFLDRRFVVAPFDATQQPASKAYRLAGLGRTPLGLGEQLTPLVARDRELAHLADVFEQARKGHGQVIGVIGDAGVGKSRLLCEFIESRRTGDALILVSSAASYTKATPYLPVIELLKLYFQIEPQDDASTMRERITRRTPTPAPALLALLDLPIDDPEWPTLDPSQRRRRTLDAVKVTLLEVSRRQPVMLVLEDLHWIDSETQAVLDTLIESLGSHRVLLLVSYRPEYQHAWGNKSCYAQIRVDPLSIDHARAFLDSLIGPEAAASVLKTVLIDRTGGNPFFLEESVRAAVETGVLVGDRGDYRLARSVHDMQVPATVHAVLEARIARLASDDKAILQTAAAIGKDVPFALLRAVADLPEQELGAGLMRLRGSELLYETTLVPDLEYAFKHALSHEVCYAGILPERRRVLHARTMEAIERLYAERLTEKVDRLAHHALAGEVWDKAVGYFRRAGAKAAARSAYREAVGNFEQALAALTHLPESLETIELDIDLRLDLRNSLTPLGEFRRVFDHLRAGESLAQRIGDRRRLGWISAFMTFHFWLSSDLDRAVEVGQRALAIARAHGDTNLGVVANLRLGQAYLHLGDHRRADECFQSSIDSLEGDGVCERFGEAAQHSVLARVWSVHSLAEQGAFVKGIARAEEALRIAEMVDQPLSLVGAYRGLGYLYLRKGDFKEAVSVFERSHGVWRTWNIPTWFFGIAAHLGYAYVLSGRVGDGVELLEQAIEQASSRGELRALPLIYLSEGYRLVNRIDEAIRVAIDLCIINRHLPARPYTLWACDHREARRSSSGDGDARSTC